MSEKNIQQPDDNNIESSRLSKRVRDLNEENVGVEQLESDLEGLSLGDIHTESSNDNNVSEKLEEDKCKRNSLSSIKDELVSSEECSSIKDSDLVSKTVEEDYFNQLADEITLRIFYWIPRKYFSTLCLVCHRFNRLIQDESLWTEVDISCQSVTGMRFWKIISRQVIDLQATDCQIRDLASLSLRWLPADFESRVRYLDLTCTRISQRTLVRLFNKCVHIEKLSLQDIALSDEVLTALSRNKNIEFLNLANCKGITEEGLKHLLKNCRKIRQLNVARTSLSKKAVSYLCSNLPDTLNRLNICNCEQNITDSCIADLVKCCPHLRDLDLLKSIYLTEEAVEQLINLKELKFLDLSMCYTILPHSLLLLAKLDSLSYLSVQYRTFEKDDLTILQDTFGSKIHVDNRRYFMAADWGWR